MYAFTSDDEFFEEDEHVATFEVGGGLALDLSVSDGYFDLGVRSGDEEPVTVGWDDEGHPHPHALRWAELDLVCRAAALLDPELRHPGPGLALLARFAVLGEHDDVDRASAALHAAVTGLRGGGDAPYPKPSRMGAGWHVDAEGNHYLVHDDAYTTRGEPDDTDFPWETWRALLAEAERTLATRVHRLADRTPLDAAVADPEAAPELARVLAADGYADRVVLRALTDPVHPAETAWVLELLSGAPRGSLLPTTATDARAWWADH